MLEPASKAAAGIKQFILDGFLSVLPLDQPGLIRCFEYMEQYEEPPMDFADATLVVSAEALNARRIFTLDLADLHVSREVRASTIRIGNDGSRKARMSPTAACACEASKAAIRMTAFSRS